jgi:hypothetical protein
MGRLPLADERVELGPSQNGATDETPQQGQRASSPPTELGAGGPDRHQADHGEDSHGPHAWGRNFFNELDDAVEHKAQQGHHEVGKTDHPQSPDA